MNKHLTSTLAAGAAVLGLAAPASAQGLPNPSDAQFAVPAGKIEQTVKIDKVSGPKAIASHTRTVQWLTSDRSHTIVTDVATGDVKAETVATPTEIRTYNAESGKTRVERRKTAGGLPVSSFTFEAAVQRVYLEQGYVRVIGEKQVEGRRALITENVAGGKWRSDPADTRTVAVVDAETHTLLERTTSHPKGDFVHEQRFLVNRLLDATPEKVRATMAMRFASKLVPAGKVQHTVVVRKVEGTRAEPRHERTEQWLTRTHSRTVVTDVESGKVRTEIVTSPTETRIYDAEKNQVRVTDHERQAPPYSAAAYEAALQRSYLEDGFTGVIGEKVVAGRKALVVESVAGKWRSDDPRSRTVATVDAETFALLERTTELPGGEFKQTEVHELTELLPATGRAAKARLAMADHRNAKIKRR